MSSDHRFRVNTPHVVHQTIDGEVVVINLESGFYYSLDQVGADVWHGLEAEAPVAEIVAQLAGSYAASRAEIEAAVTRFLTELASEALIVASTAPSATNGARHGTTDGDRGQQPFAPPTLQKYADMQDLLLLDPIHEVEEGGWPSAKAEPEPKG